MLSLPNIVSNNSSFITFSSATACDRHANFLNYKKKTVYFAVFVFRAPSTWFIIESIK